jgi:hypothetical protein
MDIKSEATYTEETVTDLEFHFSGGEPEFFTLREGDTYVNNADAVTITLAHPDRNGGTVDIFKRNLLWASERKRVVKRALPPPADLAVSEGTQPHKH